MKHILFILIPLILVGCVEPMANEDIISEVAKCEEANYLPKVIKSQWNDRIIDIECTPTTNTDGEGE